MTRTVNLDARQTRMLLLSLLCRRRGIVVPRRCFRRRVRTIRTRKPHTTSRRDFKVTVRTRVLYHASGETRREPSRDDDAGCRAVELIYVHIIITFCARRGNKIVRKYIYSLSARKLFELKNNCKSPLVHVIIIGRCNFFFVKFKYTIIRIKTSHVTSPGKHIPFVDHVCKYTYAYSNPYAYSNNTELKCITDRCVDIYTTRTLSRLSAWKR